MRLRSAAWADRAQVALAAQPRAKLSRGELRWALMRRGPTPHRRRIAEGQAVAWDCVNEAVVAEASGSAVLHSANPAHRRRTAHQEKTGWPDLFAADDHVEVEATGHVYQRMIAAYIREPSVKALER